MAKKRFQPEQIIGKLRHVDMLPRQAKNIEEVARSLEYSLVSLGEFP